MNDAENPGKMPSIRFSVREEHSPLELGAGELRQASLLREFLEVAWSSAQKGVDSHGRGSQATLCRLQGGMTASGLSSLYANTRFVVEKAAKEV